MNKHCLSRQSVEGFTLIEMLVVIIMIGILSAIAIPSYLGLINRQRLNNAQEQVFIAMRNAQANAKRERRTWAACFHDDGNKVEWSLSRLPAPVGNWSCTDTTNWQPLSSDSKVISINSTYTNFTATPATYYTILFKFDGSFDDSFDDSVALPRKITFNVRNETSSIKRCVFVDTLLGALRPNKDAGCI